MNFSPHLSPDLIPISFNQLNGWSDDDHLAAFNCFLLSATRMVRKSYSTKSLGISAPALTEIAHHALKLQQPGKNDARRFFERFFIPHRFNGPQFSGMLTGYFEPVVTASRVESAHFQFPVYRRPDDLIDITDLNRPRGIDKDFVFGRQTHKGILEYFDRGEIQSGALRGRGLELFWLNNPIDVYFIHLQGSARLNLEDGSQVRISYAAKSGHPYTPIGKILVERGELKLKDVTMQSIREWMKNNPGECSKLMATNRSHIFFQIPDQPGKELGPVAAAGIALMANRSLAVDRHLQTFATPIWIETKNGFTAGQNSVCTLMIAQDTGSAIIGPQRGDNFVGSGESAGEIAGRIKHAASMIVFVPISAGGA